MQDQMMNRIAQIAEAPGGRSLIALWGLTLAILVGTPIITLLSNREELVGNTAFSVLPAAILLDVSIVLAHVVENRSERLARGGWIGLCLVVIVFASAIASSIQPDAHKAAEIFFAYAMLTLSFPIGFLGPFFVSGLDYLLNLEMLGFYGSNFVAWLVFFVLGYLQWFKLLPWLIAKWRSRHAAPMSHSR